MEENRAGIAADIINGVGSKRQRIADAAMLEDVIEERGLAFKYVEALFRLVGGGDFLPSNRQDAWDLIRATPEQRARAFLEVASS